MALALFLLGGCDFFKELESLPGAEDGTGEDAGESGESGGTEGGVCDIFDDQCDSQDTLRSCNFDSGELETIDCGLWCASGELLNFTCSITPDFRHGCWCVEPGTIKIDTCAQLESCVLECGSDPNSACVQDCFGRTDAQTIRLLGTVYACAERACDELCELSPLDCGNCLIAARAGVWGDCGVEREVCDSDKTDEPSWP